MKQLSAQVPKFEELLWPTLCALKDLGGSASNEELLEKVISMLEISDTVANVQHGDTLRSRLEYNLGWAKSYLKIAGALENSIRGIWAITEKGEALTPSDMVEIPNNVRRRLYDGQKPQSEIKSKQKDALSYPEAIVSSEKWKEDLLHILLKLSPRAFEKLSQRLLRESGFIEVEVTGKTGDGGIDGIGVLRINLLSFRVLFQCKRYKGTVGAGTIRDFRGAMQGRSDKGLIITTGTFSTDAKREASRDGAPAIDLIDGSRLCDILKQLELGIKIKQVEEVVIAYEYFQTFD